MDKQVNTNLDDLIVVARTTAPYSLDGDTTIDVSVEKEGYTLLAVVGINGLPGSATLRGFIANPSETVDVRIYAYYSGTRSGNMNVDCLFVKDI